MNGLGVSTQTAQTESIRTPDYTTLWHPRTPSLFFSSIISYHHIRVDIWAFESCWVGETNPKHMTAMSLKVCGIPGKGGSVAFFFLFLEWTSKKIERYTTLIFSLAHKNSLTTAGSPIKNSHCRATRGGLPASSPGAISLYKKKNKTRMYTEWSAADCGVCSLKIKRLQLGILQELQWVTQYSNCQD